VGGDALYEIAVAAAVVTVTASCKIIAAKQTPHDLGEADISEDRPNSGPIRPYSMLIAKVRENDAGKYQEFTQLIVEDFDQLLSIIQNEVQCSRNRL